MSSPQLASISSKILVAFQDRLEVQLLSTDDLCRELVKGALEGFSHGVVFFGHRDAPLSCIEPVALALKEKLKLYLSAVELDDQILAAGPHQNHEKALEEPLEDTFEHAKSMLKASKS